MLKYANIVGNQEDWADFITNVESDQAPFISWLPTGREPVNALKSYQAEKYRDSKENAHVDGRPVSGFNSAGDSRAQLKALVQYFTAGAAATTLQQDVSNIAGVNDELSREIDKSTTELSFDMETAFLEDDDCQEGNEALPYKTRGVGSWLSTTAQTTFPVDANFRPPAASVITTASGSITESALIDVFESMGTKAKMAKPITAFCGPKAKRVFNNMPLFTPASVLVGGSPTGATGITYNQTGVASVGRVVERYLTDYGTVELRISFRQVALSTNATEKAYCTYFLHRDMWELAWNKKPQWIRKAYEGGSHEAFCEAIAMLLCKNPLAEGKWQPTS